MTARDRRTSTLVGWEFDAMRDAGRLPFDPPWTHASWRGEAWTSGDAAGPPTVGAVLSWNAETPAGAGIAFDLGVRIEGTWSPWTPMGEWGSASPDRQPDGPIHRAIDVASWERPADAVRVRGRLRPDSAGRMPRVRRVVVACDQPAVEVAGPEPPHGGPFVQPVPFRSQMTEAPEIAKRICGPTSLAMHLASREPGVLTADIAAEAVDTAHDVYGNWAHLAAVAGEHGRVAWVERFARLADVEMRLTAGYGAVLSVAYEPGELDGSPIPRTDGHLLVLRGWNAAGDPVCNDPAFPDRRGDGVVYPRRRFERAWADHGGATILLRSERGE